MKSYKDIRKELADGSDGTEKPKMPCSVCRAETPAETLSNFGARCGHCFTAYCRAAFDYEGQKRQYDAGLRRRAL